MGNAAALTNDFPRWSRLLLIACVVFVANAVLLVLQLAANRILSPFVGSSLETWTAVIGVFLGGIALGNAAGGRIADLYPSSRTLVMLLLLSAAASLWLSLLPKVFQLTSWHTLVGLETRIPFLAFLLCFPAGLTLSLLTPLAIRLGLQDIRLAGRVAGTVFATSTLGCLVGNYLTGFYLIPTFTLDTLVQSCAGVLTILALAIWPVKLVDETVGGKLITSRSIQPECAVSATGLIRIHHAYLIVFCASFAAMTLELAGVRYLARSLGVSLFTWTGVIGVMLAGTAAGNFLGGQWADRYVPRLGHNSSPYGLANSLLAAAGATVAIFLINRLVVTYGLFDTSSIVLKVVGVTFLLFFTPMLILGMVSPQAIRLAMPDVQHAGRVAGRIYAWSTIGAIVGTFATGYVLISQLGVEWTILSVAGVLTLAAATLVPLWKSNAGLYLLAIVLGGIVGNAVLHLQRSTSDSHEPGATIAVDDSNYYFIHISRDYDNPSHLRLNLDHLLHSIVAPEEPTYLYYDHEGIQLEILLDLESRIANPRVLVIGGGGYTFPRCAKTVVPKSQVEVVEIDPAVTQAAERYLGFDRQKLDIVVHHQDGRQFITEEAQPGSYDLIVLDAVNDYSVPAHLTTKEFNESVKRILVKNGIYLLTVIDDVADGRLWKACYRTLQQSFPYVELIAARELDWDASDQRTVFVIYASERPLDLLEIQRSVYERFNTTLAGVAGAWTTEYFDPRIPVRVYTMPVPEPVVRKALAIESEIILTDQFAPVDNLLAEVFRKRSIKGSRK